MIRFSASPLEDEYINQVRVFVFRLTKMPDLDKVRCQHNGISEGRITLFGAFVFGSKGHEDYHKVYRIMKDIAREPRELKMSIADPNQKFQDPAYLRSLNSFPIHLSYLEIIWILFVNISVIFGLAHLFITCCFDRPIFWDMLWTMLVTSGIAIGVNVALIKFYKSMIRGELKQKTLMDSRSENICFIFIKIFIIGTIIGSVIIGFIVSFGRHKRKDIETYRLMCITFASISLVGLLWNIGSHLNLNVNKKSRPSEPLSMEDNSSLISISITDK